MPFPLETGRLRIRRFEPADVEAVCAYMKEPEVRAFVPDWPATPEQVDEFVRANLGPEPKQYALVLREDEVSIGHLGFHPWFGEATYEIGWAVAPAQQGHGYATEAARALLAHGFEELRLHRVIATCQPENAASVRVMEKLGMRREAHFRKAFPAPGGNWWDEYFYALLDEDWPPG